MPSILDLARFQFGMTTVFHFFFVPLSIGLAFCVAVMETRYVKTGDEKYKQLTKFWGKMFILSFAVGVVTGIIQEFQFGMNWSDYSRFVGDIFGAPLAIEALLSFFMESVFIGVWMFSWGKVSNKVHCLFIWLVTIGSMLSALWILIANSFMQSPTGFIIENGRAQLVDFFAVVSNAQVWYEYGHVIFGALTLAAFFIIGTSAINILKNKDYEFFKKSMASVMVIALIASVMTVFVGDLQTKHLVAAQPMKFAAAEGLYEDSGDPAPWTVIATIDTENKVTKPLLEVPGMLSILAYNKTSGAVKGMNTIQKEFEETYGAGDYIPPVKSIFWSFRFMAGFGVLFFLVALFGLFGLKKDRIKKWKFMLVVMSACTVLPFVATTGGWLITELGRYPWTVYGLITIADSVSPNVSATSLLITNIVYFCLFAALGAVLVFLMVKEFKKGPYADEAKLESAGINPFDMAEVTK